MSHPNDRIPDGSRALARQQPYARGLDVTRGAVDSLRDPRRPVEQQDGKKRAPKKRGRRR
jgi:hypothetical protein